MDKVNILKHNKEKSVSGWTFDLGYGPFNAYHAGCSPWFGYKYGQSVGSIKTTLSGSGGQASLTFGNCWPTGTVNLYLDGMIIGSAGPKSTKTVTFEYSNGNELKLDEVNTAVITFKDFKIHDCEGKQSQLLLWGNGNKNRIFFSLTSFSIL